MALTSPELQALEEQVPRDIARTVTRGDRIFRTLCASAAAVSLFIIGGTALFLAIKAVPALQKAGLLSFFTTSVWNPTVGDFGVLGLLIGTIIIATVSLFGMWGFFALQAPLVGVASWLNLHLSAIPFFRLSEPDAPLLRSSFIVGTVVALMIVPIITSVSRDVMAQCPRSQCEAALALGGSRWGMIKEVLLPFGKAGITGAVLLGFGRALGETIAVAHACEPRCSFFSLRTET